MTILNVAAYRFVRIDDAADLAVRLRERLAAQGLRGSVLLAPEGINAFLAGEPQTLRAAVRELMTDTRFADLSCKWSESSAMPFRKLLVKCKREIIRFDRPEIDPAAGRAPNVDPITLQRWLAQGRDDSGRELALLDTRNQQEVAHGTFTGALTLPIVQFTQFPAAIEAQREALSDKTIVSFCTGGIRCEKAALWMTSAGFSNVLQLEGGILGYFEKAGGFGYQGRCFVFDERVSLDAQLRAPDSDVVEGQ